MKNLSSPIAALLAGTLAGCLLPASVFERASFPNVDPLERPDYWQEQGRYRQEPAATDPARTTSAAPSATAAGAPALPPGAAQAAGQPGSNTALQTAPDAMQHGPLQQPLSPAQQQPLLGWDGGVVDGATPGAAQEGELARGLEPSPAGRMHIIELYQRVLDERDALSAEVESVNGTLEQTNVALAAERTKSADLEVRLAALEESHRRSMEENRELAARLATSQIRRLEAEKLLLETKLEEARARAAAEAAPGDVKPADRRNPAKPAEPKEQG